MENIFKHKPQGIFLTL